MLNKTTWTYDDRTVCVNIGIILSDLRVVGRMYLIMIMMMNITVSQLWGRG